jgi:hypothetical protein
VNNPTIERNRMVLLFKLNDSGNKLVGKATLIIAVRAIPSNFLLVGVYKKKDIIIASRGNDLSLRFQLWTNKQINFLCKRVVKLIASKQKNDMSQKTSPLLVCFVY